MPHAIMMMGSMYRYSDMCEKGPALGSLFKTTGRQGAYSSLSNTYTHHSANSLKAALVKGHRAIHPAAARSDTPCLDLVKRAAPTARSSTSEDKNT